MARRGACRGAHVGVSQRTPARLGSAAHMSVSLRQTRAPLGIALLRLGGVAAARSSGCGPKSNGLWPSVTWTRRGSARARSGNGTDEQRTYDRSAVDVAWEMGPAHPHEENEEQEQGLGLWHLLAPAAWAWVDQPNEPARSCNETRRGLPGTSTMGWPVSARSMCRVAGGRGVRRRPG